MRMDETIIYLKIYTVSNTDKPERMMTSYCEVSTSQYVINIFILNILLYINIYI